MGILFEINDCKYFAPLSSLKPKHLNMKDTLDFIRLDNGELGAINFNNMIPVKDGNFDYINLKEKPIDKTQADYFNLLFKQLKWLNTYSSKIMKNAKILYRSYVTGRLSESLKKRCCDFKLLESKCDEYNKQMISN